MKREKFLLGKFIHLNDNQCYQREVPHKLFKIWPILEHLKLKFALVNLLKQVYLLTNLGCYGKRDYVENNIFH